MLASIWAVVWRVLSFGVVLPIWLIIAAALWVTFDKHSAIRQAVDKAVVQLVAGAELEAARAETNAARDILEEVQRRNKALAAANDTFEERLTEAKQEQEDTNVELEKARARPIASDCRVNAGVFDQLRGQ